VLERTTSERFSDDSNLTFDFDLPRRRSIPQRREEHSCPWVGLTHGLGCNGFDWIGLGRDFSVFGGLGTKVLKIWKDYVNAFKARLDKIWLQCLPIAPSSDGTVLYTTACYWLVGAPSRRQ